MAAAKAHVQGRRTSENVRRARGAQVVGQWNRPREDIHPLGVRNAGLRTSPLRRRGFRASPRASRRAKSPSPWAGSPWSKKRRPRGPRTAKCRVPGGAPRCGSAGPRFSAGASRREVHAAWAGPWQGPARRRVRAPEMCGARRLGQSAGRRGSTRPGRAVGSGSWRVRVQEAAESGRNELNGKKLGRRGKRLDVGTYRSPKSENDSESSEPSRGPEPLDAASASLGPSPGSSLPGPSDAGPASLGSGPAASLRVQTGQHPSFRSDFRIVVHSGIEDTALYTTFPRPGASEDSGM